MAQVTVFWTYTDYSVDTVVTEYHPISYIEFDIIGGLPSPPEVPMGGNPGEWMKYFSSPLHLFLKGERRVEVSISLNVCNLLENSSFSSPLYVVKVENMYLMDLEEWNFLRDTVFYPNEWNILFHRLFVAIYFPMYSMSSYSKEWEKISRELFPIPQRNGIGDVKIISGGYSMDAFPSFSISEECIYSYKNGMRMGVSYEKNEFPLHEFRHKKIVEKENAEWRKEKNREVIYDSFPSWKIS